MTLEHWKVLLTFVGAIAAAVVAAIPGILALTKQVKKDKAEIAGELTETAISLIKPMQDRLNMLEATVKTQARQLEALQLRVRCLEDENRLLRLGVGRLGHQVESLGATPVFTPPAELPVPPLPDMGHGEV